MCDDNEFLDNFGCRKSNADRTSTLVSVVKALQKKDFEKMMGSGLIVSITDLSGKSVVQEFMMQAEDMQGIKPLLIQSIVDLLKLRATLLKDDLKTIESVIVDNE